LSGVIELQISAQQSISYRHFGNFNTQKLTAWQKLRWKLQKSFTDDKLAQFNCWHIMKRGEHSSCPQVGVMPWLKSLKQTNTISIK